MRPLKLQVKVFFIVLLFFFSIMSMRKGLGSQMGEREEGERERERGRNCHLFDMQRLWEPGPGIATLVCGGGRKSTTRALTLPHQLLHWPEAGAGTGTQNQALCGL